MELVIVGNLVVDDLVFPNGETRFEQAGGAVVFTALGARLWGIETGVVSVRGDDYPKSTLESLAHRGIDLAGVRRIPGGGLRSWLLYEDAHLRQLIHRRTAASHELATPSFDDIPERFLDAKWLHVAPTPLSSQLELVERVRGCRSFDGRVSLDPFAILDELGDETLRQLLSGVDVFFVSRDELGELTREQVVDRASEALRTVVFKEGSDGGLLMSSSRKVRWTARSARVVDPTGAGDAFAGGFIAGLLIGDAPRLALRRAVVSASFAIEDWGLGGLAKAHPEAAEERLSKWFGAAERTSPDQR